MNREYSRRKGSSLIFERGCALVVLLGSLSVSEASARENPIPGARYETVRGAALSDALLGIVDDGTALFYNPAGLGKVKGNRVEPLNAQAHGNFGYFSMLDRNFSKVGSLESWAPVLAGKPGHRTSAGYSVFPNVVIKGIALGVLYQSSVRAESSADGATIDYSSRTELVPTAGFALRFASGVARLGYSIQWVNASRGSSSVAASSSAGASYRSGIAAGSGFSHNAGLAITLPVAYLPSLQVVARNIGGLKYLSTATLLPLASNTTGLPGEEPMSFDAAITLEPKLGGGVTGALSFTYRDITRTSGADLLSRFAMGGEYIFRQFMAFRAGYSGGFASLGVSILTKRAELGLAWYHQQFGASVPGTAESRLALGYTFRAL